MQINPDDFLQTENGRVIDAELNRDAWARSMEALRKTLAGHEPGRVLFLLVGAQGAGKTTWLKSNSKNLGAQAVVFDAILVTQAERRPLIDVARSNLVPVIAIWIDTPLEVCLARNANRPPDEVIPERGVRNVHAAIEAPTPGEGFVFIQRVKPDEGETSNLLRIPPG